MLDQLGLADRLAQECFACRSTASYDPDGKEVMGRGWAFMENMKDTKWDFSLVLVCELLLLKLILESANVTRGKNTRKRFFVKH